MTHGFFQICLNSSIANKVVLGVRERRQKWWFRAPSHSDYRLECVRAITTAYITLKFMQFFWRHTHIAPEGMDFLEDWEVTTSSSSLICLLAWNLCQMKLPVNLNWALERNYRLKEYKMNYIALPCSLLI